METTVNIPQSDGLCFEDTFVQDLKPDPKIKQNLLETAIYNVRSRSNIMQSAQATPTCSSSPFDHQGSAIENLDNDPSQSDINSNNQPQHPPSTLELKKYVAGLEERHRIDAECNKQNLITQHHRDLKIVRDKAQRKLDDALSHVRLSEELVYSYPHG